MRTSIFSLFAVFLLTSVHAFGQTSWLDRPLSNWNADNGSVPMAPRVIAPIAARCRGQIRQPDSVADGALTRAGWSLFGSAQTFGAVTLVSGMAAADGMCRPNLFNTFVFVGSRFAGTLSPTNMKSRSDGELIAANLERANIITAEFARYRPTDALCCPSLTSLVTYSLTRVQLRATDVDTAENAGGSAPPVEEMTTQDNVISGTVNLNQTSSATSGQVLTIRLIEISRSNTAVATIVEQKIDTSGKQMPLSFDMTYDREKIFERSRYAVQAEVRENGRLTYLTAISRPVLTQGNPRTIELNLLPIPAPPAPREPVIRGTVGYRERIALPPNSEVSIVLLNSAAPDSDPVAETSFSTSGKQSPFAFELKYNPRDINRIKNYEIRAQILGEDGRPRFKSAAGTPINLRAGNPEALTLQLTYIKDEPPAIRGFAMTLSRLGNGTLKIGGRTQYLVRGSVSIGNDGSATVSVGSISNQINLSGRLIFADDRTLRISVNSAGDVLASGMIEVSYIDRQLESIDSTNLTVDGLDALLKY